MDLWLIIIIVLYVSIGVMAAAGSIFIAKSLFSPKGEQLVFAGFHQPPQGLSGGLGLSGCVRGAT